MTNFLIGAGVAVLVFLCWHGLYLIANHLKDIRHNVSMTKLQLETLTLELGQIKRILERR